MKAPAKAKPTRAETKVPAKKPTAERRPATTKTPAVKPKPAAKHRAKGTPTVNAPLPAAALLMLELDALGMNGPYQQRRTPATAAADAGLLESIRTMGVLQPILVRWDEEAQKHQVVDGHRRVTAARAAGLATILALPVDADERTTTAAGVATNLQRAPLAPVDQWRALVHLQKMGWTLDGAAGALGIAKRTARQLDKLGQMHPDMLAAIAAHDMPEEDELAIIAGAPHGVQEAALKHPDSWDDDRDEEEGTGTFRKVPDWYSIASRCRLRRLPQSRAIFDIEAVPLQWDEDLFAQPDDADRFTTTDIDGFVAAQTAALVDRSGDGRFRSAEWDAKAHEPRLPAGWQRVWDTKTVGAVRFAAVATDGHSIGCVVEIYAVPPPEPAGRKPAAGAARQPAETPAGSESAQPSTGHAESSTEDAGEDDPLPPAARAEAPPAKPGRGPLTEKGRILVAEAKTTAIRCALRDRRNHGAGSILAVLVLAIAGDNVIIHGDPTRSHHRADFRDLVARLVAEDGSEIGLALDEVVAIAAEAAARMIVCAPTAFFGNTSGAAAEWIGIAIEAHRDMPRLDTPEILATVSSDALKAAAREAIDDSGKGTTKALRERLAGQAETLALPGSTFAAPRPAAWTPTASGFCCCAHCDDPEECKAAEKCWVNGDEDVER